MDTQLSVRLPAHLRTALDRASRELGLTKSDIVRRALSDFLEHTAIGSRPAERVRHLLGSLSSAVDLAERQRDHILESLYRS